MNTKRILFGFMACLMLIGASCTPNTADDNAYEQGVDKTKLINGDKKK